MENRRLSRHIHHQISPRHAIISPQLIQPLQKWLAKQNKFLQAPCPQNNIGDNVEEDSAYTWLGLNLLIELKTLLSLSIPVPFGFLEKAAASLSAEEQTEVGFLVENVMAELKLAVRGIVSNK